MVQRLFPGVDIAATQRWAADEASQKPGTVGGNQIAINNALHHAGQLLDLGDTGSQANINMLGSGKGANYLANKLTGAPDESAFNNTKQALLTEVQTFLSRGHPAERSIESLLGSISYNDTPDKKNKTMKSIIDLLEGQATSLQGQRAKVFKQLDPGTSYLDESAQNVVKDVYHRNGLDGQMPKQLPLTNNPTPGQQTTPEKAPTSNTSNHTLPYINKSMSKADFSTLPVASQQAWRSGGGSVY